MNDFAKLHSGDLLFKRVMIASMSFGVFFALYMLTY